MDVIARNMSGPIPQSQQHPSPVITIETALGGFLRTLEGRNRSAATLVAYQADIRQFASFLTDTNVFAAELERITRADVSEFLAWLSDRNVSGVSRARKLAALREFFRYLHAVGAVERLPTDGVETPRKERNVRTYLRPDEYAKILSFAGESIRDYAMLQTFLQTGVRVSELCALTLGDVDLKSQMLTVRGKGMVEREIELERRGVMALRNWLSVRPPSSSGSLFLNQYGGPISTRGVRKLVAKYRRLAGVTRRASCHSFRHTFATYKAEHGVSAFQLQRWLGHASIATTQIYVHLGRQGARKLMEGTAL
jgi:site-specific recombinase XerD